MSLSSRPHLMLLAVAASLAGLGGLHAQTPPASAAKPAAAKPAATGSTAPASSSTAAKPGTERNSPLGNIGSSKEPIKIDADRLDVFDKEGRAVFTGKVVAVQGDTTMQCTVMIVFYEQGRAAGGAPKAAAPTTPGQGDNAIKKVDCKGPVTVVSKTQTATGDRAEFDRPTNKVVMTGNVSLSDGQNVTRGERLVYDTDTGVANVETNPGGRVRALFVPGSGDDKKGDKKAEDKKADKPADRKPDDKKAAERKPEPQKRNTATN